MLRNNHITRNIGPLTLTIIEELYGRITFGHICQDSATIEFNALDGLLHNNFEIFSLTGCGYDIHALVKDGNVYFKRNEFYQNSRDVGSQKNWHVIFQWTPTSIGCDICDIGDQNPIVRSVHTSLVDFDADAIRILRAGGVFENKQYDDASELLGAVVDCISFVEGDLRRFGGQKFLWNSVNVVDEPEISRLIASLLAPHGRNRNFDVICEPRAGAGKIDFYVVAQSKTGLIRVGIEAKKSTHSDLKTALGSQLLDYLGNLNTKFGIYLVYWTGSTSADKTITDTAKFQTEVLHNIARGPGINISLIDVTYAFPSV